MTTGSSNGREERLHVDGRGVFTSSLISSLDLVGLSGCPVALPPRPSSGPRLPGFAGLKSEAKSERQHVGKMLGDAEKKTLTSKSKSGLKVWLFGALPSSAYQR